MRLISFAIIAVLPIILGLPLHRREPAETPLTNIIQRDGQVVSDTRVVLDTERLIAVRSDGELVPKARKSHVLMEDDSLRGADTTPDALEHSTSRRSLLGRALTSNDRRGIIDAFLGGLLDSPTSTGNEGRAGNGLLGNSGSSGGLSSVTDLLDPLTGVL